MPPAPRSGQSPAKFALAIAGHLGYVFALVLVVIVSACILLPLVPFPRTRRRLANAMLRRYMRLFTLRFLPAVRACRIVEVTYADRTVHSSPAVYVANHRSSIDGLLLLALLPPTVAIIKSRHARKLWYACIVAFFDFLYMETGTPSVLRRSMEKCRSLMAGGMNLLAFPEGMRTSSSRLMPFADFAFRMAAERGVPVVPVVIHSDRPFLNRQKGSYFPPETVHYRIRFLAPVAPQSEPDPQRLCDAVWRRMAAELSGMDREFLKTPLHGGAS
jgi:1-acyl-sn-glycerol-3-phosphate acyltransferase